MKSTIQLTLAIIVLVVSTTGSGIAIAGNASAGLTVVNKKQSSQNRRIATDKHLGRAQSSNHPATFIPKVKVEVVIADDG